MKKTKTLKNDWIPAWEEVLEFPLQVPKLTLREIEVLDYMTFQRMTILEYLGLVRLVRFVSMFFSFEHLFPIYLSNHVLPKSNMVTLERRYESPNCGSIWNLATWETRREGSERMREDSVKRTHRNDTTLYLSLSDCSKSNRVQMKIFKILKTRDGKWNMYLSKLR